MSDHPEDPSMKPDGAPYWLDDPKHVTWLWWGLCVLSIGLALVDVLPIYHKHGHYDFEMVPGFYAVFGMVSSVIIVLGAREWRRIVGRPESYYGPEYVNHIEGDPVDGDEGAHDAH